MRHGALRLGFPKKEMWKKVTMGALSVTGLGIWVKMYLDSVDGQKRSSNLFKGVMLHLRSDPQAQQLLGNHIRCDGGIDGKISVLKGVADVTFTVKGDVGSGLVKFEGRRINGTVDWKAIVFDVITPSQTISVSAQEYPLLFTRLPSMHES
jgi:hypothetical protein